MYNDLSEFKKIAIHIDEQNNLAIFPYCKVGDDTYCPSEKYFELKESYSEADVAEMVKKAINGYCKFTPYSNKKITIEEYYYHKKGFKTATKGKRLITLGWDDIGGKEVSISMPVKKGKYYMGLETIHLPDDADWIDFAKAIITLISKPIEELDGYKTFRKMLNI